MSIESQLNALAREVNELRKDVAALLAASELRPALEAQMQTALRDQRDRHMNPCETCGGPGVIVGTDDVAGACPACNADSGLTLAAPDEAHTMTEGELTEGLAAVRKARGRLKSVPEENA